MKKKLLKKIVPEKKTVTENKVLKLFGPLILAPALWRLNRSRVANGASIGVFWSFIPVPIQVLMAAICSIIWRANLPLSIGLVWIANPLTMPPMYYFSYKVGAWILGTPLQVVHFHVSLAWVESVIEQLWRPLFLGGTICGLVSGCIVNALIRLFWREKAAVQADVEKP